MPTPLGCEASGGTNITCTDKSHGITYTWENLIQPYSKNWQIMVSPLAKLANTNQASEHEFFSYGMPPTAEFIPGKTSFTDTFDCTAVTLPCYWDGIGGVVPANTITDANMHEKWSTANGTATSSLVATTVANPADMVMVCDSNAFDFWLTYGWSASTAANTFGWCTSGYLAPSCQEFGPAVRYGQLTYNDNAYRYYGGNCNAVFVDGHAKGTPIMQLLAPVQLQNVVPVKYVYQHLYPKGGY